MPIRITKRAVDGAAADAGREAWLWDSELKGFGLRLHPNGAKTYVVEYRPGPGGRATQKRRFTIGRHGSASCWAIPRRPRPSAMPIWPPIRSRPPLKMWRVGLRQL
jgi:hypothetical protein